MGAIKIEFTSGFIYSLIIIIIIIIVIGLIGVVIAAQCTETFQVCCL